MRYGDEEERVRLVIYVQPTLKTELELMAQADESCVSVVARRTLKKVAREYMRTRVANYEKTKAEWAKVLAEDTKVVA